MKNEKRFVNVSICKSNIKSKENTYYARVCKTGCVKGDELLSMLKKEAGYIDIDMMRAGVEKLVDIVALLVASGTSVDFFGLGTFSLATEGKVEIEPSMQSYLEEECGEKYEYSQSGVDAPAKSAEYGALQGGDECNLQNGGDELFQSMGDNNAQNKDVGNKYGAESPAQSLAKSNAQSADVHAIERKRGDFDVSSAVRKAPKFSLKFSPSEPCKKVFQNIEMAVAIKKRRAPSIEKIENAAPKSALSNASVIRVRGEDLKVSGNRGEVGAYIIEESGRKTKIEAANILQNTPKTLLILLEEKLEIGKEYTLQLATQYAKMGSSCTTAVLKSASHKFVWAGAGKNKQQTAPKRSEKLAA